MSLITLILVLAAAAVLIVLGTTRRKDGGDGKKTLPRTIVTAAAVLVLVGALGFGSVYQLQEDEYAVITTFGKPSVVSTSGLKFKIPIIQQKTIVSKATQGFALGYDLHEREQRGRIAHDQRGLQLRQRGFLCGIPRGRSGEVPL